MENKIFETIVVGAGHAGLSAGYYLKKLGIDHVILERGRIGESWRSQRWDSFSLNSSNRINLLPGQEYPGKSPDAFSSAADFASSLERYVRTYQLPVVENSRVINVRKSEGDDFFSVSVSEKGAQKLYRTRQMIVCSGWQNTKKSPPVAGNFPKDIVQIHASDYRNATNLPAGAVLVVGSAQSGCQITEDLLDAGRKVFLSTSSVGRIPRRYRGKDIMDWLIGLGFFDLKTEEVEDPQMFQTSAPQISGTGEKGHTISLQYLSHKGAVILGRVDSVSQLDASFLPDAADHVRFADEFSKKVKGMIDEFIAARQLDIPSGPEDPADNPDPDALCASPIRSLNFKESNITSIIWSTGFGSDFTYLDLPVFDKNGNPGHRQGISSVDGLYFLGLPWLRSRKSGVIFGIKEDAEFISNKVYEYAQQYQEVM